VSLTPSRPLRAVATVLCAAVLCARPAAAQLIPDSVSVESDGAAAAYLALTLTPVGALAPTAHFMLARPGAGPRPLRVHGRFASLDRGVGIDQRTFGATIDLPVGPGSFGITAGYVDITCDDDLTDGFDGIEVDCRGGLTLGASFGMPVASRSMDAAGTSALVLGFEGTAGYADIDLAQVQIAEFGFSIDAGAKAFSVTAAAPLAFVVHSGEVTVAPMLVPRVGYGRSTARISGEEDTQGSVRFMLGGGIAVRLRRTIGIDAGIQQVFAEDSEMVMGLGVSIGF
jgi:hypothetical protein